MWHFFFFFVSFCNYYHLNIGNIWSKNHPIFSSVDPVCVFVRFNGKILRKIFFYLKKIGFTGSNIGWQLLWFFVLAFLHFSNNWEMKKKMSSEILLWMDVSNIRIHPICLFGFFGFSILIIIYFLGRMSSVSFFFSIVVIISIFFYYPCSWKFVNQQQIKIFDYNMCVCVMQARARIFDPIL